jgi:hypothetical protein
MHWPDTQATMLLLQVTALKLGEAGGGPAAKPGRPRALVLGPTRELTEQLLRVAKSLAHHEKFASACVSGGAASYARSWAWFSPDMDGLSISLCRSPAESRRS